MGGLARRVSYETLFKAKVGSIPSLMVDTGNSFASEVNSHGAVRPDVRVKDDWILKSYDEFKVDVVNVAAPDLRYISTILGKSEYARRAATQPVLKRLISANTTSNSANVMGFQPFIVRTVPARNAGAKPVRVAFIGVTEPDDKVPGGFKIGDPIEAARRTVPEARKQADLVIVLSYLKTEETKRLATAVTGIDAVISSESQTNGAYFTSPVIGGPTLVLFTPYETRMLGELRVYREASGKFSMRTRFITLDETLPNHEAALQLVTDADDSENKTQTQSKKVLEDWLASSIKVNMAANAGSAFASGGACAQCHQAQYIKWANSQHAHATDPLPPRWVEFETGCLNCHATGQKIETSGAIVMARLQNVQCEQCHGPGAEHAKNPGKGYGHVSNMQAMCASCHTAETSPNFDSQAAWAKIKH